ncbi:hypothetical protein I350_01829 [Cryptococcus amylolentus CBS 6273]|uniref:Uncharacterized protein n=1 Tax=Cryptococcus amylolentus CBS 6273 TaxID=1296118 RepID=A0A1E3KDY8_9TREE|nr:hypothetical protein I350_01829 [Cryptococcus amylolentus CBS 6273]
MLQVNDKVFRLPVLVLTQPAPKASLPMPTPPPGRSVAFTSDGHTLQKDVSQWLFRSSSPLPTTSLRPRQTISTPSRTFSSPFANTEVVLKGSVRPGSADVKEGPTRATSHSGSRSRSRELPRALAKRRGPGSRSESYCESNSAGGCGPLAFIEILRNNTKSRSRAVSGSLRLFAVADLGRCIVERGRRIIFNFWSSDAEPPESSAWSSYLGLPGPPSSSSSPKSSSSPPTSPPPHPHSSKHKPASSRQLSGRGKPPE